MNEGYVSYLTDRASKYLYKTAVWSSFFGILNYFSALLYFIMSVGLMVGGYIANLFGNISQIDTTIIGIIYLPISIIVFWIGYLLRKFSKKAKLALKSNSEQLLEEALNAQKWAYTILGISVIISLLITFGIVITMIVAGMTGLIG